MSLSTEAFLPQHVFGPQISRNRVFPAVKSQVSDKVEVLSIIYFIKCHLSCIYFLKSNLLYPVIFCREMMLNILFCHAKKNEALSYKQVFQIPLVTPLSFLLSLLVSFRARL